MSRLHVRTLSRSVSMLALPFAFCWSVSAQTAPAVKQIPVQGQGTGVTMDAKLQSTTVKMGQSSTPAWIVEITVANYTP